MDKPILKENPTLEDVEAWESEMLKWEDQQLKWVEMRVKEYDVRMGIARNFGHVIYENCRLIYCVENAKKIRMYFDSPLEAMGKMRDSRNQPCRLIKVPIMPQYTHWLTPIRVLSPMVEDMMKRYDLEEKVDRK